jgi:hypothetical protein
MRMWMLPPEILCRKHLLGEHNEIHKFVGHFNKGKSINGWIRRGYIAIHRLQERHDELAAEMLRRGYNHQSPLQALTRTYANTDCVEVDADVSIFDLSDRCAACRERMFRSLYANRGLYAGYMP